VNCQDIQDSRLAEDRNDVSLFVQSTILQNGQPPTSSQSGWGLRPSNCEIWKLVIFVKVENSSVSKRCCRHAVTRGEREIYIFPWFRGTHYGTKTPTGQQPTNPCAGDMTRGDVIYNMAHRYGLYGAPPGCVFDLIVCACCGWCF